MVAAYVPILLVLATFRNLVQNYERFLKIPRIQ